MNPALTDWISRIKAPERQLEPQLRAHLDDLTKPLGSLGRLEEIALKLGLIQGQLELKTHSKRLYCFAGDHGVAFEGVSAFPREVTPQMVLNMLAGGAAINQLCQNAGADLKVVDMGVDFDFEPHPNLIQAKVAKGTQSFIQGPAMSQEDCEQALLAGIKLAEAAQADGVQLLGTGEMGIANTTPAAALFAAYLPCQPQEIVGRGTGVDDAGLARKIEVIKKGLELHQSALKDPAETLAALGGFEIAGIAGLVLGAAALKIPVVVDGFISSAGALAALKIASAAAEYLFFSHLSAEQGHRLFAETLGIKPLMDLDLRLGEGTGAALAFCLIEGAALCSNQMATFSGAKVSTKV
ncbi:MAG: nicotinate-nucleotide--dimethylbenzimidazole phosphoribosyltransferase [bacterium]|nr:nicotinate-nucleotide--dimethylbenzimidazole phosphoribosyltransferase [bacterium]